MIAGEASWRVTSSSDSPGGNNLRSQIQKSNPATSHPPAMWEETPSVSVIQGDVSVVTELNPETTIEHSRLFHFHLTIVFDFDITLMFVTFTFPNG